jgi:hypothetical protein
MPVILATREAETRKITVQSQPRQIVQHSIISKIPITEKRMVEWLKVYALSSSLKQLQCLDPLSPPSDCQVFIFFL